MALHRPKLVYNKSGSVAPNQAPEPTRYLDFIKQWEFPFGRAILMAIPQESGYELLLLKHDGEIIFEIAGRSRDDVEGGFKVWLAAFNDNKLNPSGQLRWWLR